MVWTLVDSCLLAFIQNSTSNFIKVLQCTKLILCVTFRLLDQLAIYKVGIRCLIFSLLSLSNFLKLAFGISPLSELSRIYTSHYKLCVHVGHYTQK